MAPDDGVRHAAQGVDVIVRFHQMSRLWELERAVFSLAGQFHSPIRILVTTQRFSPEAQQAVRRALLAVIAWSTDVSLLVLNFAPDDPVDARSELINLGLSNATGRYLAFLDYDDVLYPEAYALLIKRLADTGAAVAFARTPVVMADVNPEFSVIRKKVEPFIGDTLADLFNSNFCPIHSYVMDRSKIPPKIMSFESRLTIEEDYDFLLRLCATVVSDFQMIKTDIGLYYYKSDGSNTFDRNSVLSPETLDREATARGFVELRRKMTPVAVEVQKSLGIDPPKPGLTIREFLTRRTECQA